MRNALYNLGPLDGRYQKDVSELSEYFSEAALIKYRLEIEKKYLVTLLKIIRRVGTDRIKRISRIKADPTRVKKIEQKINHDVKAVEYYFRQELKKQGYKEDVLELVHFALTSWDINNLAYSLMFKDALEKSYLPVFNYLIKELNKLAKAHKSLTILGLTHGQPATPTTLGKELAVFTARLKRQLKFPHLLGKLNGATGNWAAHQIAFPEINWLKFSEKFVKSFGLKFNPLTTQIEPYDSLAESYQQVIRINNILKDLCQDVWLYISRGVFKQKIKKNEVGSSTMPHKVNPIYFENAEGSLGLSIAIFSFLANKLTVSRLQRDLSDSIVIRNQGLALAYSFLAVKNVVKGLNRLQPDKEKIEEELDNNWQVLAEAIQVVLRKVGYTNGYERLKELTRGRKMNREAIQKFVDSLDISYLEKKKLKKLSPSNYIGLSVQLLKYLK